MKKLDIGVVVTTLIIVTISCSLAFFAARVIGNPKDINLVAKNVAITFTDTSSIASDVISPGWNNVKTFTITNNSKEDFSYNITLKGLVNTFESINTLQYKITSDNGYNMDNYLNVIKTETSKDVVLAYNITIPKNTIQSYQVEFNYVSTEEDQSGDMGKKLGGTLAIEASTGTPEIYDKLLADNPTIKTRTDFSTTLTETNVNTLYKSQEDNTDVYYFAGDARNNWVKFGGYYWRIIRTNSDGSIRLLYSGTSSDTIEGYIGNGDYNTLYKDTMYNGYMYGTSGSLENNRANTTDSTIKNIVDTWYKNNLTDYTKYLSKEAVYCNDRSITNSFDTTQNIINSSYSRNVSGSQPTYDCMSQEDSFSAENPLAKLTYPVGLITADEFVYAGGEWSNTKDNEKNIWVDSNKNNQHILSGKWWWTMTPSYWMSSWGETRVFNISQKSYRLDDNGVYSANAAIRPVISIKGDNIWKNGDGSAEHPYEIKDFTSLKDKVLSDNPKVETRSDFSTVYTTTNTGKIYKSTENETTVYYFAGNAQNNWVKFGTWNENVTFIIGRNEDKNGHRIFESIEACKADTTFNFDCEKVEIAKKGDPMYWRIIRTNSEGSVRLLYAGTSVYSTSSYVDFSAFNETNEATLTLGYMYGTSGSLENNRANTTDSAIKSKLETWYANNMTSYTKYLSTSAVYCNDRSAPAYSNVNRFFNSSAYRNYLNNKPNYNCGTDENGEYLEKSLEDRFSVNNSKAKLKYPVGLVTGDELVFAGAKYNTSSALTYYYCNAKENCSENSTDISYSSTGTMWWWTMTPFYYDGNKKSRIYHVGGLSAPGYMGSCNTEEPLGIRPVISIKENAVYKSGNGSPESPYEIVLN